MKGSMAVLITLNDILMTSYVCYVTSLLFSLSLCLATNIITRLICNQLNLTRSIYKPRIKNANWLMMHSALYVLLSILIKGMQFDDYHLICNRWEKVDHDKDKPQI